MVYVPFVKIHPTPHLRWVDFFASKLYLNKADLKRERKKRASFLIPNWSQNFPLLYEERQVQSPARPLTPEEGERGGPGRSWVTFCCCSLAGWAVGQRSGASGLSYLCSYNGRVKHCTRCSLTFIPATPPRPAMWGPHSPSVGQDEILCWPQK